MAANETTSLQVIWNKEKNIEEDFAIQRQMSALMNSANDLQHGIEECLSRASYLLMANDRENRVSLNKEECQEIEKELQTNSDQLNLRLKTIRLMIADLHQ